MQGLVMLATALVAEIVSGQSTATSQTTPQDSASATSSAADATWTNPLIASLWSDAASLISTYYPSSTITNVGSLSWPTVVVIGSTTHTLTPGATTLSTSTTPTSTSGPVQTPITSNTTSASTTSEQGKSDHTDKRLGIGLGVGIGIVALGVLVLLVWLLHRRRKHTGSFASRRPTSPSDDEIQAWRGPSSSSLVQFPEKYATMSSQRPPMPVTRPHAAFTRNWTNDDSIGPAELSSSSNDSNPFHTPYESYAELAAHESQRTPTQELHGNTSMRMLNDRRPPSMITTAALSAVRPSTPHTTALMRDINSPVSPVSPADGVHHGGGFWRNPQHYVNPYQQESSDSDRYESGHQSLHDRRSSLNPFLSEEDDDVLEPPGIPSRSPQRRSSPVVHYPSGDELSTFNFGLYGAPKRWADDEAVDGGDGWKRQHIPARESNMGRHEMA